MANQDITESKQFGQPIDTLHPAVGLDLLGTRQVIFPFPVELAAEKYSFSIWNGEQMPDRLIAYDTETEVIQGNEVPRLALATVFGDQGSCYFIHPDDLHRFVLMHQAAYWVCHNAAFDFWTTAQQLRSDPSALSAWWAIAGGSRLICTMLLDALIRLARNDADPVYRDLATVSIDYCPGIILDKNDPYRQRYGELIGLPATAWAGTESGFWAYAALDPIATQQVAQQQFRIARELINPYRHELLPNASQRFGPLTVCVQVQGSIALDYISRVGVQIDLDHANSLRESIAALIDQHHRTLEQLLPGCFHRFGPRSKQAGQLKRTTAGVPRRNTKMIKMELKRIAKKSSPPLRPRTIKDGSCTDSVKYWEQHQQISPFIDAHCQFMNQAKLAQFFNKLNQPRIYPRYHALKRTGRTSCSEPNLQQLPRDTRFREMIVAVPGYKLLQIDYSVVELTTLAQVCLMRYGRSRLAELFHQGIDPHKYTASLLLGVDLEQFKKLSKTEQKQHRQRAKVVNFGVPGALGAAALVLCAKQNYGVEMTIMEARKFRKRLITYVYPELSAYLQDNHHQAIAENLHASITLVRQAIPRWEQVQNAARIISGYNDTADGDPYAPGLIEYVWTTLQQLNRNPDLRSELANKRSSATLMRRCFFAHALTISGRLRGHVSFSQCANSSFQGLAADGNKLAMFRLLRAGFIVCGFIHDEMLVLVPIGCDYTATVQKIETILIDSMREFCPDIPISCEYLLADRWYKDAPGQPRDEAGRIIPYSRTVGQLAKTTTDAAKGRITQDPGKH